MIFKALKMMNEYWCKLPRFLKYLLPPANIYEYHDECNMAAWERINREEPLHTGGYCLSNKYMDTTSGICAALYVILVHLGVFLSWGFLLFYVRRTTKNGNKSAEKLRGNSGDSRYPSLLPHTCEGGGKETEVRKKDEWRSYTSNCVPRTLTEIAACSLSPLFILFSSFFLFTHSHNGRLFAQFHPFSSWQLCF